LGAGGKYCREGANIAASKGDYDQVQTTRDLHHPGLKSSARLLYFHPRFSGALIAD
jgi:hypothetical protein